MKNCELKLINQDCEIPRNSFANVFIMFALFVLFIEIICNKCMFFRIEKTIIETDYLLRNQLSYIEGIIKYIFVIRLTAMIRCADSNQQCF